MTLSHGVSLSVTATGWVTTFQDLGRRRSEQLGVPTGGAADQHSASVANILVGNPRDAVLIESLGGEFAFVPSDDVLIAVTGAPAEVTVGHARIDSWSPVVVPAGHEVRVRDLRIGARAYIALNGVLRAERFLGSAAPDPRMGFGQTIARGSTLRLESAFAGFRHDFFDQTLFRLPVPELKFENRPWHIDVLPSAELATIPAMRELVSTATYTVTDRSNHVGLRLSGAVDHPDTDEEIVSHGVPIGALEVPHSDELIVLGRYRSLTAGYPIVGFAARESLPLLGQAAPGRELRFRWIDREEAVRQRVVHEGERRTLTAAVAEAFDALGFTRRTPLAPLETARKEPA
jgi:biotin-dependent carboxylase-like uncharacterized protein